MDTNVTRGALGVIAAGLGFAGSAKLAGTEFTEKNFKRWGYPDPARFVIGAIEVGLAGAAVGAQRAPGARPVAATGTLCAMACALGTHIKARDTAPNYGPPILLTAAALIALASD